MWRDQCVCQLSCSGQGNIMALLCEHLIILIFNDFQTIANAIIFIVRIMFKWMILPHVWFIIHTHYVKQQTTDAQNTFCLEFHCLQLFSNLYKGTSTFSRKRTENPIFIQKKNHNWKLRDIAPNIYTNLIWISGFIHVFANFHIHFLSVKFGNLTLRFGKSLFLLILELNLSNQILKIVWNPRLDIECNPIN